MEDKPGQVDPSCLANFNALRRQIRVMDGFQGDVRDWEPLLIKIADMAEDRDIDLSGRDQNEGLVPAVANQVLVSAPNGPIPDSISSFLDEYGFVPSRSKNGEFRFEDETRSVLLYETERDDVELAEVLGAARGNPGLRDAGVRVTPNLLMAMNVVTKSKSGAEPACCHPAPKVSGVDNDNHGQGLVVIIDTGKFLDGHRSDWLKDVTGHDDPRLSADGYLNLSAGHGTFVAGVVRQVRPNTRVHVLSEVDSVGFASDADVAKAINQAKEHIQNNGGHGVINLSLGVEVDGGTTPEAIEVALNNLPDRIAVVAAAGNRSSGNPVYPAAFPRAIAVAALDRDGQPSDWSNRWDISGEEERSIEFSAIGEGVVSTYLAGEERPGTRDLDDPNDPEPDIWFGPRDWAVWTGTSFAAPQISALLAEILAKDPDATVDGAKAILKSQGTNVAEFGTAITGLHVMVVQEPTRPPGDPDPLP